MHRSKILASIAGVGVILSAASLASAEFRAKSASLSGVNGLGVFSTPILLPDGSLVDEIELLPGNYTIAVRTQLDYKFADNDSGSGSDSLSFRVVFVDPDRFEIVSVDGAVVSAAGCAPDGENNSTSSVLLSDSLSERSSGNWEGCNATSRSSASWSSNPGGIPIRAAVNVSLNSHGNGNSSASSNNEVIVAFVVSGAPGEMAGVGIGGIAPSDLNVDGIVDTADLGILIAQFGTSGPDGDINLDGIVDTADLGLLIGEFGAGCP